MKIYIIDFEKCLKNYSQYHDSIRMVNNEKKKFTDQIESIKKEMESIITQSRSFLLDASTKQMSAERFKELQEKAIRTEQEFRNDIVTLQNSELEKNFESLSVIMQDWSKGLDIDMLLNKNSVIWSKSQYDATDEFIQIMKELEVYSEWNEELFIDM
jgi:Skp family chaperone for outer membrane proteins